MIKAKVYVMLKPSVLDPQGKAVHGALESLGYNSVEEVRISKMIEVTFNTDDKAQAEKELKEIADKVLANPNTEIWKIEF